MMTPANDTALDSLHASATGIFTGALKACNIATAFDRRLRFDGDTLQRLMPDGCGPATINLSDYKRVFVIALGNAAKACVVSVAVLTFPRSAIGAFAILKAVIRCPMKIPSPQPAQRSRCLRKPKKTR
jgi:hypothetical protein